MSHTKWLRCNHTRRREHAIRQFLFTSNTTVKRIQTHACARLSREFYCSGDCHRAIKLNRWPFRRPPTHVFTYKTQMSTRRLYNVLGHYAHLVRAFTVAFLFGLFVRCWFSVIYPNVRRRDVATSPLSCSSKTSVENVSRRTSAYTHSVSNVYCARLLYSHTYVRYTCLRILTHDPE